MKPPISPFFSALISCFQAITAGTGTVARKKILPVFLAAACVFVSGACFADEDEFHITPDWKIAFAHGGKLKVFKTGWFSEEEHIVRFVNGRWVVYLPKATRIDISTQPAPEKHSNRIRLEPNGGVSFWVYYDEGISVEHPKIIKGHWMTDATDHWQTVFDDECPNEISADLVRPEDIQ